MESCVPYRALEVSSANNDAPIEPFVTLCPTFEQPLRDGIGVQAPRLTGPCYMPLLRLTSRVYIISHTPNPRYDPYNGTTKQHRNVLSRAFLAVVAYIGF